MTAARRLLPILFFGVLPVVVAIAMFATAHSSNSLAADFHSELYPEAELLLDWTNPFPGPDAALQYGHNLIWPPLAAFLVAPFTLLSAGAADWTVALVGLACALLSLRIVGVRDWRVYGVFALWPSVIGEIRVSHLTPVLCLLLALAWRYRDTRFAPGLAVGFAGAIKFFLWPLGVWLAAIGRVREMLLAAALAGASLLLVLPFTSLEEYLRTLIELGRDFDQDSYSPFGFLAQVGVSETPARIVSYAIGAALLVACWRRASLGLAVAAALVLSPIVWLDYYAVAAVPLAVVRPRLSAVWFLPIATWGLLSAGLGAGNGWGSARVLIVFGIVFAVIVRGERQAEAGGESHRPATVEAPAAARIDPKPSSS
ncbi:MAG TPA: glycosyltransferase family 87 protein [Candidatus Limnocylindrales bacterium]|nr:glycosyltransferase family 87 protein [Candidatus Limnocylindrales bacterium]